MIDLLFDETGANFSTLMLLKQLNRHQHNYHRFTDLAQAVKRTYQVIYRAIRAITAIMAIMIIRLIKTV